MDSRLQVIQPRNVVGEAHASARTKFTTHALLAFIYTSVTRDPFVAYLGEQLDHLSTNLDLVVYSSHSAMIVSGINPFPPLVLYSTYS